MTKTIESSDSTILSVSQLNELVINLLDDAIGPLWIDGEISNFTAPRSGHWYFSVKDDRAQIRCAMFVNKNRIVKFEPKNGMKVRLYGTPTLYAARGDFQLIVDRIVEDGIGKLQLAYQQLLNKLKNEGLFEDSNKSLLPPIPQKIGIISSPTAAALQDILKVLKRRNHLIPVELFPAYVQGEKAPASLINALTKAQKDKEVEVIIIARGGGSLEDLWAFNDEGLARAIYSCQIPIVSGVGHETDFTIVDFVSDVRAPTPSAAAELVSKDICSLEEKLAQLKINLISTINHRIERCNSQVRLLRALLKSPRDQLKALKNNLRNAKTNLFLAIDHKLQEKHDVLKSLTQKLELISPLATLARGYSIVKTDTGKLVKEAADVKINTKLHITTNKGQIIATTTELKLKD